MTEKESSEKLAERAVEAMQGYTDYLRIEEEKDLKERNPIAAVLVPEVKSEDEPKSP